MLNRIEEELPFMSDIAGVDDTELQEITKYAMRSTENLIEQLEGESPEDLPMCELLSLDKQLRNIRGSLKVEKVKKVKLQQCIERGKRKLEQIRDNPEYNDGIREDIRKRIKRYNDDLKVRQENIDLPKGRLTNQITSFKETITKVLDKGTSLAEKIQTLFGEQGIMIASVLMASLLRRLGTKATEALPGIIGAVIS